MAETVDISHSELKYLQSNRGRMILPCWTEQSAFPGVGHIKPNSGACQSARYEAGIQPMILSLEDMQKARESDLLPIACLSCAILARAVTNLQYH